MKFKVIVIAAEIIEEITNWFSIAQWIAILIILGITAAVAVPLII